MLALSVPDWSQHTLEFWTAVGTVGAVLVAVLGSLVRSVWRARSERRKRPAVTLAYQPETDLQLEALVSSNLAAARPAAYARLRVVNKLGRHAAEGVQVLLTCLQPLDKADAIPPERWRDQTTWNVGSLGWTHADPPDLTIGPGAMRTVDLGRIEGSSDPYFTLGLPDQQRPASRVDRMPAGRYLLTLLVVGHNFDATAWEVDLTYDGQWVPHSSEPRDHLTITKPRRV